MGAIACDVRLEQLRSDADACGPEARALFDRLLSEGKTPEAAAMYACQKAAGMNKSDRAFCQGQRRKMENMTPWLRKALQDEAKKAGVNTDGKFYIGGLADKGKGARDQSAWVSSAEDVISICKAKNLGCDGVLERKRDASRDKPPESVPLAPDIVQTIEKKMLRNDPALRERVAKSKHARKELHERIVDKHARKKRSKPNLLLR